MTEHRRPLIAFHLPQFHPIPENDVWWGKGFTEWTNVTRARPLFKGHYQPHLPADLGFYDLRLAETRAAQADLARQYGVTGFCYYHYWFQGRRLLERPVNDILRTGEPDFPFCLCWANEPWSRNWDGGFKKVLVAQDYAPEDDLNHIRWLLPVLADRRYIRVDGKPLMLIYRASQLPNVRRTLDVWRDEARKTGLGELFLARVENHPTEGAVSPQSLGFEAAVQFSPDWRYQPSPSTPARVRQWVRSQLYRFGSGPTLAIDRVLKWIESVPSRLSHRGRLKLVHRIHDYADLVQSNLAAEAPPYRRFRCVCPGWDNTARRARGALMFTGSTPELYEHWLKTFVDRHANSEYPQDPIFVNAWNEWAEGCHLEPCQKWGRSFLEATARAVGQRLP